MTKLKPCPFCGCEVSIFWDGTKVCPSYTMDHPHNGCFIDRLPFLNGDYDFADLWNRRVNE